jgi:hypothetical protein
VWYIENIHNPVVICGFLIQYYDWLKLCPGKSDFPFVLYRRLGTEPFDPMDTKKGETVYNNLFVCIQVMST